MNEHTQYKNQKKPFDAYPKDAVIQEAKGSRRVKQIQEISEIRSTNFALDATGKIAAGWRLTRRGLEIFNSGVFPPASITFTDIQNISSLRILGRTTAGSGSIEQLTTAQVKTLLAIVAADIPDFVEAAQDAIGSEVDASLTYADPTPSLGVTQAYRRKSLFDHYATVGNVGTGVDDLYSDTIAANQLTNNGEKIEASYTGHFVGHATATRELRVVFAGTEIFTTTTFSDVADVDWSLEVKIIREQSTVVRCSVTSVYSQSTILFAATQHTRVTGLDLTTTNILKLTGEAAGAGAATNDITATMGEVEWKAAA